MTRGLRRFQESGQSHFVTFSCFHRKPKFSDHRLCQLFLERLETMRVRFDMCVYGYVIMPEHVHLLVSEPKIALADALHYLKLSFSKLSRDYRATDCDPFWQKRYYDRNIRSYSDFTEKLRYIHRNPVKRGLCASAEGWKWSSFRHYACVRLGRLKSNRNGPQEFEN